MKNAHQMHNTRPLLQTTEVWPSSVAGVHKAGNRLYNDDAVLWNGLHAISELASRRPRAFDFVRKRCNRMVRGGWLNSIIEIESAVKRASASRNGWADEFKSNFISSQPECTRY